MQFIHPFHSSHIHFFLTIIYWAKWRFYHLLREWVPGYRSYRSEMTRKNLHWKAGWAWSRSCREHVGWEGQMVIWETRLKFVLVSRQNCNKSPNYPAKLQGHGLVPHGLDEIRIQRSMQVTTTGKDVVIDGCSVVKAPVLEAEVTGTYLFSTF